MEVQLGSGTRFSSDFSGQQRIQGTWIHIGGSGVNVKVYVRPSD